MNDEDDNDNDDLIPAFPSEEPAQNPIVPYPTYTPPLSRLQKKNARNRKKSDMKRDAAVRASNKTSKHSVKLAVHVKCNYIKNAAPIAINFDSNDFQTSTGYTGKRGPKHEQIHTLGKMVGEGSKYNF